MSSKRLFRIPFFLRTLDRSYRGSDLSNLKSDLSDLNSELETRNSKLTRAGSALVIVLGMLSVLLLMGVAFSITMRTERAGASNMRHAAMARHILDSALARTMADLDRALEEQGDLPVPTGGVIVTVSSKPGGAANVNPLCYEASLHLPPDQLIAAVYTNAQWLPIYGDVRITSNDKNDPASADSPVGRYAYVILNGCGYLDPNIVGDSNSNRLYGLTPYEIDIEGDNGNVLGMDHADDAHRFLETRDDMGHFATMGDFLTAANNKHAITNLLGLVGMDVDNKRFPTNSFFVGSLALDDLAPPTGVQKVGQGDAARYYPIRKPKFALRELDSKGNPVMIDPKDLIKDSDWCAEFLEAMTNSFLATYAAQESTENGRLKREFDYPFYTKATPKFPYPVLAARNLLEMMDDDFSPGGSRKHKLSEIGDKSNNNEDEYLAAFGYPNRYWDRLPCVEPVPMLDNLIIVGGYDPDLSTQPDGEKTPCLEWHVEKEKIPNPADPQNPTDGNVTGIVCTVTLTLCASSDIYVGWNVPKGAEGKYTYNWRFTALEADYPADDSYPDYFQEAMDHLSFSGGDLITTFELERNNDGTPERMRNNMVDFYRLPPVQFCVKVDPGVESIAENDLSKYIPDNFGLVLHAVGIMGRGDKDNYDKDVVQVVPCQENSLAKASGDSVLDVYLPINREEALTKETKDYVLGATYALDPRFAYKKMSWVWTPGIQENTSGIDSEPDYKLRKSLVRENLASLEVLQGGDINPLTDKYLHNPRQEIGGLSLFRILEELYSSQVIEGGVSDVMRSFPTEKAFNDLGNHANSAAGSGALSVFFDSNDPDHPEWAFTRVGQLGFVPIGMHRTIALMDGFDNALNADHNEEIAHVEVRQRVLDYFTMYPPRDPGSSGSGDTPGDPVKSAKFISRVGINPPLFPEVDKNKVIPGDPNLLPLTAALNGCVLREFGSENDKKKFKVDWNTAADLADMIADSLDRDDTGVRNADNIEGDWKDGFDDAEGVTRSLSVLGRSIYDHDGSVSHTEMVSIDAILHDQFPESCDFDREGVIRNTSEMLTTRQQLFTILLKADSFTPMFGFTDADHGTALASVQAIAHVWRDPEPLRDADGKVILDNPDKPDQGHPIHAWVLLDLYQF